MNLSKKYIRSIILIVAAIIVWGFVLSKFFGFSKEEIVNTNSYQELIVLDTNKVQSYILKLDYDDPFLKNQVHKKNEAILVTKKENPFKNPKHLSVEKQVEPIVWPEIYYKGMGSNKSRKEESMAWIEFDKKMKIVKVEQIINGYKVEKIYTDSLIISRDGVMKSYKKMK